MFRVLFLVLLGPVAFPLLAHDLWIERNAQLHTLSFGHAGYGHAGHNHDGERKLKYEADTVKQARCYASNGQILKAETGVIYPITLKGDCAASWFLVSTGYWSKTAYGTRNQPKTETPGALDSWLALKSIKRIDRWGEGLSTPFTQELELVLRADPSNLKAGDKLALAAYFQGKAAAGVGVAYLGKHQGVTAGDGSFNIRLNKSGQQLIQASLKRPLNDPKADRAIHATALQFGIQ